MLSIDQNCHSLWDTVPKLQALALRGCSVRHYIEDVDVAFTSLGSGINSGQLRLAPERFHRSGGSDWGAALFYSKFLGRLPVEVRQWEPLTGVRTSVLARQLGRSVDDLYEEFSPSENWQLVGPSYAGSRQHHRVIADLTVAETAEFVRQTLALAMADMLERFPEAASQRRLKEWFGRETGRVEEMLRRHARGRLVEVCKDWLGLYADEHIEIGLTFSLFACRSGAPGTEILDVFVRDYELAATLYNEAVEEADCGLRRLKISDGELPFFAVLEHEGHAVRTGTFLRGDQIQVQDMAFRRTTDGRLPLDEMARAGVRCLAGKAVVLVIQVRLGTQGGPLVLPYRGSPYMPAADRLAQKLAEQNLLPAGLHPVVRIRFHFLDRLRELDTAVRLPPHVAAAFGRDTVPASVLGENYAALAREATDRLEAFKDPQARQRWQHDNCPETARAIEALDSRRRQLARTDPKGPEIRTLWREIKALQTELTDKLVRQIATDYQVRDLDYFDSRGALLPWSVALGGEEFYNRLIAEAELNAEPVPDGASRD